ncbi:MAG: flavin reductase family protein [Terracidiphilus sp.]
MFYAITMGATRSSQVSTLSFNPAGLQPQEIYKLMTGIIVPRPVALVSTMSREGVANLAPFSFFSGVGAVPPTVLFCPALRDGASAEAGERKDTLRNVEETGEFVINVVSEAIAEAANATSAEVPFGVDEFALSGLTPIPSEAVRPPRVAQSPAQMECKSSTPDVRPAAASSCSVRSSASMSARVCSKTTASIPPPSTPWAAWPATPGSAQETASSSSGQSRTRIDLRSKTSSCANNKAESVQPVYTSHHS